MNNTSSSRLRRTALALLATSLFSAAPGAAEPLLRENFAGATPKGTLIATEPRPEFNYWYAPDNHDDSVNGSRSHGWSWGLPNDAANWVESFAGSAAPEEQKWLLRKLSDGGALPSGKAVAEPKVTGLFGMGWGGNSDPGLFYNLALLTPAGNGYVAQVGRAGVVTLYRLDNGLQGGWAQIATKATGLQFNTIQLSLSVTKGAVNLTSKLITQGSAPGPELTAADTAHAKFTTVGLAGLGLAGAVDIRVRNLVFEGRVVPGN